MIRCFSCFLVLCLAFGCKSKNKKTASKESYFSVRSYLLAQTKQIDTSLYRITKIETVNGRSDTAIIPRDSFRSYARDFLNLPDISSGERKKNYDETNTYDDVLQNVLLTYTANDPDEEVRRETVMLETDDAGNSAVRTIIINQLKNSRDSSVEKDMTWHVGRRFQVVTKTRVPGKPEQIRQLQVKWNDFSN